MWQFSFAKPICDEDDDLFYIHSTFSFIGDDDDDGDDAFD